MLIDGVLIDGVLIGVSFLAEAATGVLIAVALATEVLFLEVTGVIALVLAFGSAALLYPVTEEFLVIFLLDVLH